MLRWKAKDVTKWILEGCFLLENANTMNLIYVNLIFVGVFMETRQV